MNVSRKKFAAMGIAGISLWIALVALPARAVDDEICVRRQDAAAALPRAIRLRRTSGSIRISAGSIPKESWGQGRRVSCHLKPLLDWSDEVKITEHKYGKSVV
jgi:hypothetical protein